MGIKEEYIQSIDQSDIQRILEIIKQREFAEYINQRFCEYEDDFQKYSPLVYAIIKNVNPKVIEALFKFGADINEKPASNEEHKSRRSIFYRHSPIDVSVACFKDVKIFDKLIELGADPHIRSYNNSDLPHIAASHGNIKALSMLKDKGYNITVGSLEEKKHTIFTAIFGGQPPEFIEKMIEIGVDPHFNLEDQFLSCSIVEMITEGNEDAQSKLEEILDYLRILQRYDVDIYKLNEYGKNFLYDIFKYYSEDIFLDLRLAYRLATQLYITKLNVNNIELLNIYNNNELENINKVKSKLVEIVYALDYITMKAASSNSHLHKLPEDIMKFIASLTFHNNINSQEIHDKLISKYLKQLINDNYTNITIKEESKNNEMIERIKNAEAILHQPSLIKETSRAIAYRAAKKYNSNCAPNSIVNPQQLIVLKKQIASIVTEEIEKHGTETFSQKFHLKTRKTFAREISNSLIIDSKNFLPRRKQAIKQAVKKSFVELLAEENNPQNLCVQRDSIKL